MKKEYLIVLFVFPLILFGQNKNIDQKNKELESTVSEVKLSQDSLKFALRNLTEHIKLQRNRADSLEKEILFYRVKDDFYSAALSDQSTRFTLIISGILALLALLSFGAFKLEVARIEKLFKKKHDTHESIIKRYEEQLKRTNNDLLRSKGNIYSSIALNFKKESNFMSCLQYHLLAAKVRSNFLLNRLSKNKSKSITKGIITNILANLEAGINAIEKIEIGSKDKEALERINVFKKHLNDINKVNSEDVKDLAGEIRLKLNDLVDSST